MVISVEHTAYTVYKGLMSERLRVFLSIFQSYDDQESN